MSFRNIFRSRFFNLFYKTMGNERKLILTKRYSKLEVIRILPTSKYYCLAFFNLIYFAKADDQNQNYFEKPDDFSLESALRQSDEFFFVGKFHDSARILEHFKDSENVEVLWRMSRALYNISKQKGLKTSESASLINKAYEYINKALSLDTNHYAVHKWMAILFDAKSALDGMKARINALPIFKQHLMTAIELNPKDATSIYMLGQYMYNIADMSWLQKTIAKTLFGTPPEATFEEAFYYFSKAEEVDPNFYSANLLMLGKTCLKLKKIEAGCYWLRCAIAYPVRTDEDEAVRLEAEELLQKHPDFKEPSNEEKKKGADIK